MIDLTNAHENNLVDVDLSLPLGTWTAVTGVSGSGKTSLVFDTLVREGRRRYLGSWSPRARLMLGKLGSASIGRLTGLPVPLAVGAGRMTRTERSTVGTLTGISDLLRLVWARDGSEGPHARSAFSFNAAGACPTCKGVGDVETIAVDRIVVAPEKSIRDGALGPTLPNGYTVYSQVTVDVMDTVCQAHDFTVDTPWKDLTPAQQEVVLYGTKALVVPFGKHSLESRLKWEGITARPRQEGYYRGLVPVMTDTLQRSRNANILRYAASVPCSECEGTRLGLVGRTARVGEHTFPHACATPLTDLPALLDTLESPVLDALNDSLRPRIDRAITLGLGHLSLARTSTTLSDGELQRTRLLSQLGQQLGGMLLAFDEPTLGLHPSAHDGLQQAIDHLLTLGNTVLTVEHDPFFVTAAHHHVQLGPGAGSEGGRLTADEPMPQAPLPQRLQPSRARTGTGDLVLRGASLHTLDTHLTLRRGAFNVVIGPSGSGKSSLVFGTLLPALRDEPGAYESLSGHAGLGVVHVDARPLGKNARSTVATYTKLLDPLRKLFAALPASKDAKLKAGHFSYNNAAGRCPDCEGLGLQTVGLHLLRNTHTPCPSCDGGRYAPEVLTVRWKGLTIAELLACTVREAKPCFAGHPSLEAMATALCDLGLGYLQLGRGTPSLSRGEAQRIRLATQLGRPSTGPTAILLDEPDRGLHPSDLQRLLDGLHALVDAGHTLVAISHHPLIWRAADHVIGVEDGRATLLTELPEVRARVATPPPDGLPTHIRLRNVRTHNLKSIDVDLPHRALTAVVGRSGSGKSSLVFDTLVAMSERRFAESLPFQVRRFLRQRPAPEVGSATGLTPCVSLSQRGTAASTSTVGTLTGIAPLLRLLFARAGRLDGQPAGLLAEHFSHRRPAGRCPACDGAATERACDVDLLLTSPHLSLAEGAMHGTKVGRFFTEPNGRHLALLSALLGDDLALPWNQLTPTQQNTVLHGHPEVVRTTWAFERGKRRGEHALEERWEGVVALVNAEVTKRAKRKDAAAWQTAHSTSPCGVCAGSGLRAPAHRVTLNGHTWSALQNTPLHALSQQLGEPAAMGPVLLELHERLTSLTDLALGHLPLARRADHLSAGEFQRVRLAEVLDTALTGLTVVLDEPGRGLDVAGRHALSTHLRTLTERGNTVVFVSHHADLIAHADHCITLGPGAGANGGTVVRAGPPPSSTAPYRPRTFPPPPSQVPDRPGLFVLTGPSGSGKSTWLRTHGLAADKASSASTLAFALGWMAPIQKAFHAANPSLSRTAFSHRSAAGRCPTCKGEGTETVSLDILADLSLACGTCNGRRYRPEVLEARLCGLPIDAVLQLPLSALGGWVPALEGLAARAVQLGIGHLPVGIAPRRLSGGELQRLTLLLALGGSSGQLGLDDPTAGLHPDDVQHLLPVLSERVEQGATLVVVSDDPHLLSAATEVWSTPATTTLGYTLEIP